MTPQEKAMKYTKTGDSPRNTVMKGKKVLKFPEQSAKDAGFGIERRKNVNWKKLAELAKKD